MTETDLGSAPSAKRPPSRWLIALIFAALFTAGVLAGVTLDRAVLHHRHGPFAGMRPGPGMTRASPERRAEMQKRLADRMTNELQLTPDQRRQFEALLPQRASAFDSLRTEMDARLRTLLDSSAAEVDRILTPEQQAKWQTIRRKGGPAPPL